jgi:hypothetical protein
MKTKAPFPQAPFSSGVTPAARALACSETLARFLRKGVTLVRGLRPLRFVDSLPPWGGPAEAA